MLASSLGFDALLICAEVDGVMVNFGRKDQQVISEMRASDVSSEFLASLPEGSMRPKVEACVDFVKSNPSGFACIGSISELEGMMRGDVGTRFVA